MATTTSRRVRYPALHHRNFTLIWAGLLVSNMGTWMQNVAQSWLLYKLTGNNALYLGWLGLSFAIPMTLVPPLGGVVADRVDRIRLLYVTQTCSLLLAVLLAILTWAELVRPGHILATTFVGALLLAFDNPTRQALIPELVPRDSVQNAISLNSATYTGAALIGPALAGVMLGVVGAGWLFMLNALSYFAVIGALWAMRNPPSRTVQPASLRDSLLGGIRYVARHRIVLLLLGLSALAALFGRSYQQLLPVFADEVWRTGSFGYGALLSAGGAGALLGAFGMSSLPAIRHQGRVMIASGFTMCLTLVLFALSGSFWVGVALLLVTGIASTVFTTMIATVIQLRVPGELRGRVMSLYAITLIGLPSLGALGIATLAQALGREASSGFTWFVQEVLGLLYIIQLTGSLGSASGAPRAVVSGALVLVGLLLIAIPALRTLRGPDNDISNHNNLK